MFDNICYVFLNVIKEDTIQLKCVRDIINENYICMQKEKNGFITNGDDSQLSGNH